MARIMCSPIQPSSLPPVQTVSSPNPGRSIKRKRRMLSCAACRSRRLKCDKLQPRCGRCIDNSIDHCVYIDYATNVPVDEEEQRSSKRRESMVLYGHHRSSEPPTESREQNTKIEKSRSPGYLSTSGGGKSKYVSAGFWACVGTVENHIEELLQSQNQQLRINVDDGQNNDDTNPLAQSNFEDEAPAMLQNPRNSDTADLVPGSLESLLKRLPPREICDLLYKIYFVNVHAIIPIIHGPSFQQQYNTLLISVLNPSIENTRSGTLAKNPSFLALLFAVLYAASTTCSADDLKPHFTGVSSRSISVTLLSLTKASLTLVSFPQNPALDSLSAFLVSQNMLMREEEAITTCSFVGTALRIAQGMGLHRDGSHFNLDPVQEEMRRRIWWHIIHTDVMTSIGCGLPPIWVDDGCHDTRMISERGDGIEIRHSVASVDGEAQNDVRFIVAVGRYSVTNLLRNLLRRQLNIEPFTREDFIDWRQRIDSLSDQIQDRIKRLDELCSTSPSNDEIIHSSDVDQRYSPIQCPPMPSQLDGWDSSTFCRWGKCLLRLMLEKTYCLLYQPLIRKSSTTLWEEVRSASIQHCHSFLDIFLEMCANTAFRNYHWLYPGIYQALQPMAVVLADLCQKPESSEATTSRQLMDRVFSVLRPGGGVVTDVDDVLTGRQLSDGGKKAWSVLKQMKREAWAKAGFDPDVLWITPRRLNGKAMDISRSQVMSPGPQIEQIPTSGVQSFQELPTDTSSNELQSSPRSAQHLEIRDECVSSHRNKACSETSGTLGCCRGEYSDGDPDAVQDINAVDVGDPLSIFSSSMNGDLFDWSEWDLAFPESVYSFDNFTL